ncbi:hypothetical protein DSM100688_0387 [Bifidobacterium ramosum]|uniref:Uncharacterized protein n=1 Tax=Bifidobacterium ramosum TaxID=1798158 RepID=A0A6L4X538_9BIFI|nr:hypothetical protein [Bifidobacterium ramosum]KAB8289307.1 hypothetical protein DSM100688_0387 [Bifidobacterium ramosum]NEG71011.1 hypothetical protein [Bifidobacterium ramosum]
MRRTYGLDLDDLWDGGIRVGTCADLAANLPPGSLVWRRLDVPDAWTPVEHLLALQADQMNMWMWGNADPKKRGPRPEPLPRPGTKKTERQPGRTVPESRGRAIKPVAMTLEEFEEYRSQRFVDIGAEPYRSGTPDGADG